MRVEEGFLKRVQRPCSLKLMFEYTWSRFRNPSDVG